MAHIKLGGVLIELPEFLQNGPIAERLETGNYERTEAALARKHLKPGMRVIEIGAGLGYVSSLCAEIAGAENVTCFEANPQMVEVARQTLDLNGHHATAVEFAAVVGTSIENTDVDFVAGKHFWGSALADFSGPHGRRIKVPAVPLQDVLDAARPVVVIMDVEGAELDYMNVTWPACVKTVIMELHPKKYGPAGKQAIFETMQAAGFVRDQEGSSALVVCFKRD